MQEKERTRKSKHLSLVLRHDPGSVGITLTEGGWASVSAILLALNLKRHELDEIVRDNNKQRFEYTDDELFIRARQGHTVSVDLGYDPVTPPNMLFHGTSTDYLPKITVEGLKKMLRHHVHLSADINAAVVVAKRRPRPIILTVDARAMSNDGLKFYLTPNGVWLTDYVDPKYIH